MKNVLSAIEHRHRLAGMVPPLVERLAFKRIMKAVSSVSGTPSRLRSYRVASPVEADVAELPVADGAAGHPDCLRRDGMLLAGGGICHADVRAAVGARWCFPCEVDRRAGDQDLQAQAGQGAGRAVRVHRGRTAVGIAACVRGGMGAAHGRAVHQGLQMRGEVPRAVLRSAVPTVAWGAEHTGAAAGEGAVGADVAAADLGRCEGGTGVDRRGRATLFWYQHMPRWNHGGGAGEVLGAYLIPAVGTWNGDGGPAVRGSGRPAHLERYQQCHPGHGAAVDGGVGYVFRRGSGGRVGRWKGAQYDEEVGMGAVGRAGCLLGAEEC